MQQKEITMAIITIPALLLYVGLVLWFIGRRYLPRYYAKVSKADSLASAYRLARTIQRLLSIVHSLVFFAVIALPPLWFAASLSQIGHPKWGADIRVYSGFRLHLDMLPAMEASGLRDPVISGETLLHIDTSNRFAWYLFASSTYLSALIVLYVLLQLRNTFVSLSNGEAFTSVNSVRLQKIGMLVLASQLAAPLLQYYGWGAVLKGISLNTQAIQLYPAFELNLIGIFTGLAVLVLSGVMKEAVQMRDEQRLTI
jgi:hypothetical protein